MRLVNCTRTLGPLAALVVGAFGSACAPTAASPGESVAEQRGSLVQIDIGYTRDRNPAIEPRLDAEAHFVRYRAADPAVDGAMVASLLGLGDDERIPLDTCRGGDRSSDTGAAQGAGAVEVALLDAGTLALRARDGSESALFAHLEAQHYPELFPFVSGVIYGQETIPAPALSPGTQLEVEAEGGEDVGPFLAAGAIPVAFPDLSIQRDSAGRIDVNWSVVSAATSVIVDVRWAGPQPGTLRCRPHDAGRLTIDAALLPGIDAALSTGAGAQVSVARSERAAIQAPSAGAGILMVTLRDTAALSDASPAQP
jgi:hypothetical protein